MSKNRFGRRFITDREFLDYAYSLNLFIHQPSTSILEFLEKHRILMPVTRIHFPPEIVRRWYSEDYPAENVPGPLEGDTKRLAAATSLYQEISFGRWDKPDRHGERLHSLDQVDPAQAEFVQKDVHSSEFIPWNDFGAVVAIRDGIEIKDSGNQTRHLYHYWQIFPLASYLRSGISILYDLSDQALFEELHQLEISASSRTKLYTWINLEARHELKRIYESAECFEAVAYYEAYQANALQAHYQFVDRLTRRLPLSNARAYNKRRRAIAQETLSRHSISPADLQRFIQFMCDLWCDAVRLSPPALANEYKKNIAVAVDLYKLVSKKKYADLVKSTGMRGGYFKPVLEVIFPDWLADQRDLAIRSLRPQVLPTLQALPKPFALQEAEIQEFCDWIEKRELLQFYWHFNRLVEFRLSEEPITMSGIANEITGLSLTIEMIANAILVERGESPRPDTLSIKIKRIFQHSHPKLIEALNRHSKLTQTRKITLKQRLAQIERLKGSKRYGDVLRPLIKLLAIRNEGVHLGLSSFDRVSSFKLFQALLVACLIVWSAR